MQRGTSYGAPTEMEVEMAEMIAEMVPSIEMVRLVNSGTEATMSAIRLARGYTEREIIIKFDGCYHGHADCLLVSAGSGVATFGIPGSPGVPTDLAKSTISLPFNDVEALDQTFRRFGSNTAAVIVEPIAGNMGVILPQRDFLDKLRERTARHGALLIFDEVISGFRVAPGGAQALYDITPDLTCLGKIIGGGLPVGAYGGKREIMARMAPEGDIYQAGTLSGNPLAVAAGLATLKIIREKDIFRALERNGTLFFEGLREAAAKAGVEVVVNYIGSMGSLFFTPGPVTDYATAKASNEALFRKFFAGMLAQGIYLAPSPFEAAFLSTAHSDGIIRKTLECAAQAFRSLS
jgi:glutamate-1-semialdehyde 2,1-aminomutase